MENIAQILDSERVNDKQVRLYKTGHHWLAFERSAFNLFSVSYVDSIIKIPDMETGSNVLIAILKEGENGLLLNSKFSVLFRTEDEICLDSNVTCGGFQFLKDSLIPLLKKGCFFASNSKEASLSNLYRMIG